MMKLTTDIDYLKDGQKKNDQQHEVIIQKIDHLSDTFQGKIQDKADQKEIVTLLDKNYVTKESFSNVQKIVYGLAGAVLLAFVYALITKVFK